MPAPFFHLPPLRAVLAGVAAHPAAAAADEGLARSLFPRPIVTAGVLLWPQEQAYGVLHAWARWTRGVPDEVTSVGRLVRYPRLPAVPAALRGRAFVAVEVAIPGEPWVAAGRLAALRGLEPEVDAVAVTNPDAVPPMHLALELPGAATGRHLPLRSLPAPAVDAFLGATGPGSGSNLASAELRHLGRAYAASAAGRATDEEDASRLGVRLDLMAARLAPYAAGWSLRRDFTRTR